MWWEAFRVSEPHKSVVWHRPFRSVFIAQSFAELADQLLIVAMAWAVLSTEGGGTLGLVLAFWATPRGLFLLFGGVIVDRVDRRVLGAACGTVLALLVALLAALVSAGSVPVWLWLTIAVGLGLLDGVRLPIGYSLIPLVVAESEILDANRWSQLRLWATLTAGPAAGGVLTGLLGPAAALLITAGSYLLGGVLLLSLPPLTVERGEATNIRQDLVAGFRLIQRNAKLRLLLPVFAAVNLFVLGITAVGIPVLVKETLAASAQSLGFVTASFGVGLIIGTAALLRLPKWFTSTMAGLFCLFALSDAFLAATGLAPSVLVACVLFGLSGLFIGPASAIYQSTLQTATPQAYLGRVTSMSRAVSFGLEPVSAGLIGATTQVLSAGVVIAVGGSAAALIDVWASLRGRRLDRTAVPATGEPAAP